MTALAERWPRTVQAGRRYAPGITAAVLLTTMVFLVYGYVLRVPCNHNPWSGQQYSTGCYNDIQAMYGDHGLNRSDPFPYIHGRLVGSDFQHGAYEYPVLTGLTIWAFGSFSPTSGWFLWWTAILLGACALVTGYLLVRDVGSRAFYWAAAPALVLYAFYNWDALPVCAAVAGLLAWRHRRYGLSALLLSIGASFKLFPGFFLLPVLLERWHAGDRRGALRVLGIAVATTLVINVPFIVANPSGWWIPWRFQATRGVDVHTIWSLAFPTVALHTVNVVSGALTIGSWAAALVAGWLVARDRSFPVVQVSAVMLTTFLLWNKVDSLQYALWVVPFFALLKVRPGWWVAFVTADFTLYWGYMRAVHDGVLPDPYAISHQAEIVGAWWRIALLTLLTVVFWRAAAATRDARDETRTQVREADPAWSAA